MGAGALGALCSICRLMEETGSRLYTDLMVSRARNSDAVTPISAPMAAYSGPLGSSFMAKVRPMASLPTCSTIWERAVPVMRCMPCRSPRYAHGSGNYQQGGGKHLKGKVRFGL